MRIPDENIAKGFCVKCKIETAFTKQNKFSADFSSRVVGFKWCCTICDTELAPPRVKDSAELDAQILKNNCRSVMGKRFFFDTNWNRLFYVNRVDDKLYRMDRNGYTIKADRTVDSLLADKMVIEFVRGDS